MVKKGRKGKKAAKPESLVRFPRTADGLNSIIRSNEKVVLVCFSGIASVSRESADAMWEVAKEHLDIKFVEVNTFLLKGVLELAPVDSVPTYIYMENGRETNRLVVENFAPADHEGLFKVLPEYVGSLLKGWLGNLKAGVNAEAGEGVGDAEAEGANAGAEGDVSGAKGDVE